MKYKSSIHIVVSLDQVWRRRIGAKFEFWPKIFIFVTKIQIPRQFFFFRLQNWLSLTTQFTIITIIMSNQKHLILYYNFTEKRGHINYFTHYRFGKYVASKNSRKISKTCLWFWKLLTKLEVLVNLPNCCQNAMSSACHHQSYRTLISLLKHFVI